MYLLLRSVATGALFVIVAFFLYQVPIVASAHRKHAAIGAGYWYGMTVGFWLFWLVMGLSFVLGMYLMMRFTHPPLYR